MKIILACDRSGGHIFPASCLLRNGENYDIDIFAPSPLIKEFFPDYPKKIYGRPLKSRNIIIESFFRFWEALFILFYLKFY